MPFTSHRGDRDFATTVLSVLAGAHGVGEGVLGFFTTREAHVLRLVCVEFKEAVAIVPWADLETRIINVGRWRTCFPRARKANISCVYSIVDADFVHFEGIHTLNMFYCSQAGITDAAFVHLKGIHTLNMSSCIQAGITDAAFAHLEGIHTLKHVVVQAGGHHGRRVRPPRGDPHALYAGLHSGGHYCCLPRSTPRRGPPDHNVTKTGTDTQRYW